ncbi:MAG: DnaJ C-terminal domain-containing protein [Myxococcota bacterium]
MNPYSVLGVAKTASIDEIKKAYRKLARDTHPDLNPGDKVAEARFKEVSVAYDVLSDEEKRKDFDEFGEVVFDAGFDSKRARAAGAQFGGGFGGQGGRGGSPFGGGGGGGFEFSNLDDLMRQFGGGGGGGRPRSMRQKGRDIEASMSLGFMEAVQGGERRISVSRPRADGSVRTDSIQVRIPPGVSDGGTLRIPRKGGEGMGGGPAGDLQISVRVEPHPVFRRKGRDLEFDLPITLAESVLGARVEVPTLDGRATLTIPAGTSSHARLRLKGRGVPESKTKAAGHLDARIKIVVPKEADPRLVTLLETMEAERAENADADVDVEGAGTEDDPRKGLFS